MKLDYFTKYLLTELGYSIDSNYPIELQYDTDITSIVNWLYKRYKVEYELLSELHDRLIRGRTWRNVHKFTIRISPTSSRSWSSRDFDKALQRVLFELKKESSPDAD